MREINQDFLDTFAKSKRVGKVSEKAVIDFFSKFPGYVVKDVSELPEYQDKEVDLIVWTPSGEVVGIEVKGDTNSKTWNFAIETVANEEIGRPGWIHTTDAQLVAYHYINGLNGQDDLYFIEVSELRELISKQYFREYRVKPEPRVRGEGTKQMSGVLVPRASAPVRKSWKINS